VRFWDSSAIVPLLFTESSSGELESMLAADRQQHVWWATEVECVSAVARVERQQTPPAQLVRATARLQNLVSRWSEVSPAPVLREAAKRLLRVHDLRASDAFQLAAALVLADGDPSSVEFVSLDHRLRTAANREGLNVLPASHGR
jgi:predicted nucleic acid-binding protein